MGELTLGLLGAGRHAVQSHLAPLRELGHRLLVWDPDPAALARVAEPGAVRTAAGEDDVLDGCDGLVVCSPDRFHTPALLEAVRRGLPVLVDKPVAVTREDLAAVRPVLLGERPGVAVSTCHPRRTDPPFTGLADRLPELTGRHGPVTRAVFRFDYPPPRAGQPLLHASLLTDHVGHELDLLDFLLGVPERVDGRDALPAGEDPQLAYRVEGVRSDGVAFTFTGRRTDPARTGYDELLTLTFADGTQVDVGSGAGTATRIAPDGTRHPLPLPGTDYRTRFLAVNADFAAVVAGETAQPYVSGEQIWRNSYATVELDRRGRFTLHHPVTAG